MAAVSRGVAAAADSQLAALVRLQAAERRPGPAAAKAAKARAKREPAALLAPLPPLPPPMVTGNYEANATSCHLQARRQQLEPLGGVGGLWEPLALGRRCLRPHPVAAALPNDPPLKRRRSSGV